MAVAELSAHYEHYSSLPNRFIVHRDKQPLNKLGKPAPHADPNNQMTLPAALRLAEQLNATGIGFSVPEDWVVIDFDHAVTKDGIAAWALAILSKMPPTLTEVSPSGTGLHSYYRLRASAVTKVMATDKATDIADGKIEFLRSGFYATVTGNIHPKYAHSIAELDGASITTIIERIAQVARSNPSLVAKSRYDEQIYKATDVELLHWRELIRTGQEYHDPTQKLVWYSAYNRRDRDAAESELYELYDQCEHKDQRWRDRRKKIASLISRAYRNAVEVHAKVKERRAEHMELSETGNARYIAAHNDDDLQYTKEMGWLRYNGQFHEIISEHLVRARIQTTLDARMKELYVNASDAKEQTVIHKWHYACHSHKTIANTESIARGVLHGKLTFDVDGSELNCPNGIIDLETGQLYAHDKSSRHMYMANVEYRPPQPTPVFDQFMLEAFLGDADMVEYMLRCIGYSMTGETREQKFFVMYGSGGNGKTTLSNIMRNILGDPLHPCEGAHPNSGKYFGTLRSEALTYNGNMSDGIGNDLVKIAKARFVLTSEIGDRKVKDERLKALTGEDSMQVRLLYHEFFTMSPNFKLWMQTNQRPRVRGNDEGIWRRAIMFPFLADFRAKPDQTLGARIFAERHGILAKFIQYAGLWYREGLPPPPTTVVEETSAWRSEMDSISRYLEEKTIRRPDAKCTSEALWQSFQKWCLANNERPGTSATFYSGVRERIPLERARIRSEAGNQHGYKGIELVDALDAANAEF